MEVAAAAGVVPAAAAGLRSSLARLQIPPAPAVGAPGSARGPVNGSPYDEPQWTSPRAVQRAAAAAGVRAGTDGVRHRAASPRTGSPRAGTAAVSSPHAGASAAASPVATPSAGGGSAAREARGGNADEERRRPGGGSGKLLGSGGRGAGPGALLEDGNPAQLSGASPGSSEGPHAATPSSTPSDVAAASFAAAAGTGGGRVAGASPRGENGEVRVARC
jgi:hypothetical protein